MTVKIARDLATTEMFFIRSTRSAQQSLAGTVYDSDFDSRIKEARSQLILFCNQLAELEAEAKRRKLRIPKWQTTKLDIDDALGRIPSRVN